MTAPSAQASDLAGEVAALRRRVAELERQLEGNRGTAMPDAAARHWLAWLLAEAPVIVWTIDADGTITLSEGSGLEALGLRSGELTGKNFFELYAGNETVLGPVRRALNGEELRQTLDLGDCIMAAWVAPLRDAQGRVIGASGVATDITERARAEQAVREAEERWRSILEHTPDIVYSMDRQGRLLYMNHVGSQLSLDDVVGTSGFDYVAAEHHQQVRDAIEAVFRTREPQRYEVLSLDGEGGQRWYSCRLGPVLRGGDVVAVAGAATDVTERRHAEQALRDARDGLEQRVAQRTAELRAANQALRAEIDQRIRAETRTQEQAAIVQSVLDSMADGVVVANSQGELLLINPAAATMTGLALVPGSKINDPWPIDVFRRDQQTAYPPSERPLARAIRGESVDAEEMFLRHRPPSRGVWLQVNARPLKDQQGARQGGVVVMRDVTEQKRALAALGETELRLHSILDNTPSIVYLKDAAGRYLLVNRAYEAAFGVSEEQVIGRPSEMIFPAEIVARFRENDRLVLESRMPFQFEEDVPVAGGIRTFLSVKFPVCNPQGEPFAVCGISTDITDRKDALERLRLEQEFLNQLIREHERDRQLMAYEIHDGLVQYMSGALLHLEGLAGDQAKLSSKGRDSLELAVHLIRRSIAEGRRVMSGLRPPILDEEGVVPAISYLVAEDALPGELVIGFSHRVSFDRLEPLLEGTIFRIVQEALTNVKRHSQAKRAEVKLIQCDGKLRIEVRDWGVGFNPAEISGEHFGLKGIRKRADLLGGQARIESAPGTGTHVIVDLPLQHGERGKLP